MSLIEKIRIKILFVKINWKLQRFKFCKKNLKFFLVNDVVNDFWCRIYSKGKSKNQGYHQPSPLFRVHPNDQLASRQRNAREKLTIRVGFRTPACQPVTHICVERYHINYKNREKAKNNMASSHASTWNF